MTRRIQNQTLTTKASQIAHLSSVKYCILHRTSGILTDKANLD